MVGLFSKGVTMAAFLDAINAVITSTGSLPVNNPDIQHPNVLIAREIIERFSRSIQSRGWWFNKEIVTLTPTVEGFVLLPSTVLMVDAISTEVNAVQRGSKLYDLNNNTNVWAQGTEIPAELTVLLDYEDLPFTVWNHVVAYSKHEFLVNKSGESDKIKNAKDQIDITYVLVQRAELRATDPNKLTSPNVATMLRAVKGMKTYQASTTGINLMFGSSGGI